MSYYLYNINYSYSDKLIVMKQFGCALCGRKFTAIDNLNVHQECGHVDPKKHRLFAIEDGVLQFRQKKDGDEKGDL